MDYEHDLSFLPAIRWGSENEDVAHEQYINEMSQTHVDFTCTVSGLIINSHLGASRNGLMNCKCCGRGLLEIKCLLKKFACIIISIHIGCLGICYHISS